MKFKKGDNVVVIKEYGSYFPVGKEFTIGHVNIYNRDIIYDRDRPTSSFIMAENLEFSIIYNTPLYKALS